MGHIPSHNKWPFRWPCVLSTSPASCLVLTLVTTGCLTLTPNVWQVGLAHHTWSRDQLASTSITLNKHLSQGASPQSQHSLADFPSPVDMAMLACCAQGHWTCDSLAVPLLTVHEWAHLWRLVAALRARSLGCQLCLWVVPSLYLWTVNCAFKKDVRPSASLEHMNKTGHRIVVFTQDMGGQSWSSVRVRYIVVQHTGVTLNKNFSGRHSGLQL